MSERVTTAGGLKVGDVVTVATKTRRGAWWKRFAVVSSPTTPGPYVELIDLTLDMSGQDERLYDLEMDVVYLVPNEQWPEGVSAMYAKALAKGWIKLT